ncbi:MAG: hypothetical protein AAFV53_07715 [Myxococcota bacterium]
MNFSSVLNLGPDTHPDRFQDAITSSGGSVAPGPADSRTGMIPLDPSGPIIEQAGFERLRVFAMKDRIVRVFAMTTPWKDDLINTRYGAPTREDGNGARLWAFSAPRWSIEARRAPTGRRWQIDVKFLDDGVAVGLYAQAFVDEMYAALV